MQRPYSQHGFSLMELLMVLALVVTTSYLLMPDWHKSLNNAAFLRQQQSILKLFTQGRTWALVNNKPLIICGWSNHCIDASYHQDTEGDFSNAKADVLSDITLIAFDDSNNDHLWQPNEKVIAKLVIRNINITFNRGNYVRFSNAGSTAQSGSWELCYTYQGTRLYDHGIKLILNSSGNVRTTQVVCAV